MTETGIPEDYRLSGRTSGYLDAIGPVYEAGSGADYRLGLRIGEACVNARGFCHGGVFSGLADVHLGRLCAMAADPPVALVTTHLAIDYLAPATLSQWLEAVGRVDRLGRSTAHASGYLRADGKRVVRANAVFQVVGPRSG